VLLGAPAPPNDVATPRSNRFVTVIQRDGPEIFHDGPIERLRSSRRLIEGLNPYVNESRPLNDAVVSSTPAETIAED
jgi:hypothetical protein